MDVTKPYNFIGFGDIHGPKEHFSATTPERRLPEVGWRGRLGPFGWEAPSFRGSTGPGWGVVQSGHTHGPCLDLFFCSTI
jgi:hypothetical protein